MKIYEIEEAILNCIDKETGEILDITQFEALNIEKTKKIDSLISYYKAQTAMAEAIRAEEKQLAERRHKKELVAENIKNYIEKILAGVNFESARHKVTWRRSEAVTVTGDLDQEYLVIKTSPDKKKIKEALKAGETVAGAELEVKNNMGVK